MTADLVTSLLLAAINNAAGIASLLATLHTEKRDATPDEWSGVLAVDAVARKTLFDAIARARALASVPSDAV